MLADDGRYSSNNDHYSSNEAIRPIVEATVVEHQQPPRGRYRKYYVYFVGFKVRLGYVS